MVESKAEAARLPVAALLNVSLLLTVIVVPERPTWAHLPDVGLLPWKQVMALDPSKAAVACEGDEVKL